MELTLFSTGTMNDWVFIWLAVIILTIIIEIITVGLTAIWLTGGGIAALVVCLLGGHWGLQLAVFFVVTFILIYFTRPWALKYIESRKTATNYEEVIGKTVRIIEDVDNVKETGKAIYNGMEWTARAKVDTETFSMDEQARVVGVQGVKLILEKIAE
ncbi:MAG: NfeD family protein [Lachnospiraceae bacterium]|nr:NfeD family protein [Lachnospiraceae bacterium]